MKKYLKDFTHLNYNFCSFVLQLQHTHFAVHLHHTHPTHRTLFVPYGHRTVVPPASRCHYSTTTEGQTEKAEGKCREKLDNTAVCTCCYYLPLEAQIPHTAIGKGQLLLLSSFTCFQTSIAVIFRYQSWLMNAYIMIILLVFPVRGISGEKRH